MDQRVVEGYQRFARLEAHGVSPTYEEWANGIAADRELVELIAALPRNKQQPNLIFAAARSLGCPIAPYAVLRPWLLAQWSDVSTVAMQRATQTNEAGRCAVQLPCRIDDAAVPDRLPEVIYRGGVDLNPIDVRDTTDVKWLETLIWPEHQARRDRLHAAAAIAAANPAALVRGDLIDDLPGLVDAAPPEATVVVFHTAVLAYLEPQRRQQFADLTSSMPAVTWISNEGATVLPTIAAQMDAPVDGRMIVALDGTAVALAGPHGQTYERIPPRRTQRR